MPQKHTQHSCVAHPMYPGPYKCNSRKSTFVEFCVDGINLNVENNFIDSLGLGRDSNPDPSVSMGRFKKNGKKEEYFRFKLVSVLSTVTVEN